MHTHKCQQCKTDFTPTRGAKGLFCSHKCMLAAKSAHWDKLKGCIQCHTALGMTGSASGRMVNEPKHKICKIKKKYGIKAMTNSEAQLAKHSHKKTRADRRCNWDTWWGGDQNAQAWMRAGKCPLPDWWGHPERIKHQSLAKYHAMSREQRKKRHAKQAARRKTRRANDPIFAERERQYSRQWNAHNKDRNAAYAKQYRRDNPEKFRRSNMNPQQRARDNMRTRFKELIKTARNGGAQSFSKTIGCTTAWLKEHIEAQWEPWMSWDNYGTGEGRTWHIDHIIPCAAFDHTDPRQVATCWHWTNLRPLCAEQNMNKGDEWGWNEVQLVITHLNSTGTL
jgi:hypothetical protein